MTAGLAPDASIVPRLLNAPQIYASRDTDSTFDDWLRCLVASRREFGITRIGSVTRLDRTGLPVVQVARPLSLSNAVSQGKGVSWAEATASALMESIEGWAGERIPDDRLTRSSARGLGPGVRTRYEPWLTNDAPDDWDHRSLTWIEGWDLLARQTAPVPAALVDTVYTLPSPHPTIFPRTTTGLGAGRTVMQAILQAGLEVLEREAIAEARRTPRFFDMRQLNLSDVRGVRSRDLLSRVDRAGLLCGLWHAPAAHGLPVYWCHLMERGPPHELVPLPSEGFGCDFKHDDAIAKAILEASQARGTAISGAREDITRLHYPREYDRAHLAEWRKQLTASQRGCFVPSDDGVKLPEAVRMERVIDGLRGAGATAAIVVPLFSDGSRQIHVVRLIAPPLRLNPRAEDEA